MTEKKESKQDQILEQYEYELRTLLGGVIGLAPKYGVKLVDLKEHVETILKETTE